MARPSKIWFRAATGWWMVTLGGNQHKLARGEENKKNAEQKFHELMAESLATRSQSPLAEVARVADVIEAFLAWAKRHLKPESTTNYIAYGQGFSERWGYLRLADLKPYHVTKWVDEKSWGPTTQYNAKRSVFRAFSWATEEGIVVKNPLKGMRRPKPKPREGYLKHEDYLAMLRATDRPFRVFLFALRQTGARPKELRQLRWSQVREDRLVLREHKTAEKTGKPRHIYLSATMQRLMVVLRGQSQSEFVFLNARGRPWTKYAVSLRVRRLKKKLGLDPAVCAYLARHAFGTEAILNGVDPMSLKELMGHSSLDMISTVYVHLADHHEHLQDAVERATKRPAPSKPRPAEQRQGA